MNYQKIGNVVLRAGVAFAFLYPPLNALVDPTSWLGYFPSFVRGYVPDPVLLHGFGAIEIVIGLWILSNKKIFIPSMLAVAILLAIVIVHPGEFQVLFRDLSIAAAAAALALEAWFTRTAEPQWG